MLKRGANVSFMIQELGDLVSQWCLRSGRMPTGRPGMR